MRLTFALARTDLRRHWRSYVGVSLLVAVALGLALFALAGARRTQSAFPRFLRSVDASDISVASSHSFTAAQDARFARLPGVERSRTYVGLQTWVLGDDGLPDFTIAYESAGTPDGRYYDQDRFTVTHGRMARRSSLDEVVVNVYMADRYHLHVGQRLRVGVYSVAAISSPGFLATPTAPDAGRATVTIAGIGRFPDEVVQDEGDRQPRLLFTPAFTRAHAAGISYGFQGLVLRDGRDGVAAVKAAVLRQVEPGASEFDVLADREDRAVHGLRPLGIALGVFGAITLLAGVLLVAQAIARVAAASGTDREVLRSIGTPSRVVAGATLVGLVVSILAGTVLAVALAWLASPLMPIGPVRDVDPGRGFSWDGAVLGAGGALAVALLVAIAVPIVLRAVATTSGHPLAARRSRAVDLATRLGLRPSSTTGLRFAFERADGTAANPTRSVVIGEAVALTCLVGAITFGASLAGLLDRPDHYGWTADAVVLAGNGYGNVDPERAAAILDADSHVAAWSGAWFGAGPIDGVDLPLLGMDAGAAIRPPLLSGAYPTGRHEVVLGQDTADRLGKGIGDKVVVGSQDGPVRTTVVGIATFPAIGTVNATHTSLGRGALLAKELVPGWNRDVTATKVGDFGPRGILIRYAPGTDPDEELATLHRTTARLQGFDGLDVLPIRRPAEIVNAGSIGTAPVLLAVVLVVASALSLVLALGAAVRHRQGELVVLKALGCTCGQLRSTVRWQATATMLVGMVVGIPLGVALGRSLWSLFAHQLHVVPSTAFPYVPLVAVLAGGVVVANLVAFGPARRASRVVALPAGRG